MRELELRLALVCYGGASLAVYMNGITHEILKLVRASRAYQSSEGERDTFDQAAPRRPYATDTESLYFELLKTLGPKIDIRVVVDAISGTSAGGINGIFLARALAHDLDFDPLKNMWMELGDVEELMDDETIAERSSKFYLYPFIWLFRKRIYGGENTDQESRRKLNRFLRSRWFKPPFSGERMLSWMLNACKGMGKPEAGQSLMPPSHRLDLFVSLTNFFGQPRWLKLHDPKRMLERQHKVSLNFTYNEAEGQNQKSDFDDDNIPGLGFAARATSSFPGAFPPIRFLDLEAYIKKAGILWPSREKFLRKNFPHQLKEPAKLQTMSFIDGGVTNNKPFGEALDAIYNRSAHREVDRRVIYVDPNPDDPSDRFRNAPKDIPGFFRTILSSLAEIPRNEPIYGDLRAIAESNKDARRIEGVYEAIDADVQKLIDQMLTIDDYQHIETAMLSSWRERAHRLAQERAGFTYGTYLHSKIHQILEKLATLIVNCAQAKGHDISFSQTLAAVTEWADTRGILSSAGGQSLKDQQAFITFLRAFDVDYRVRRLRFTVKKLNSFIQRDTDEIPAIFYKVTKKQIYKSLEEYRSRWRPDFYKDTFDDVLTEGFSPTAHSVNDILATIDEKMMLEDLDYLSDEFCSLTIGSLTHTELKLTLFRAYVGYAFYDILTLPLTAHADLLEVDEVRVDRISPIDCGHLHGEQAALKGTNLFNFGAFFSRKARENDYLWGRIHAAHRLTDFILNAAGTKNVPEGFDVDLFKKKLTHCILDSEEPHMKRSKKLIERLRKKFLI
ncbi:MAG: patatin-like protein [Kordiimonas sp.]